MGIEWRERKWLEMFIHAAASIIDLGGPPIKAVSTNKLPPLHRQARGDSGGELDVGGGGRHQALTPQN